MEARTADADTAGLRLWDLATRTEGFCLGFPEDFAGSSEARQLLQTLAGGTPFALETQEAQAALTPQALTEHFFCLARKGESQIEPRVSGMTPWTSAESSWGGVVGCQSSGWPWPARPAGRLRSRGRRPAGLDGDESLSSGGWPRRPPAYHPSGLGGRPATPARSWVSPGRIARVDARGRRPVGPDQDTANARPPSPAAQLTPGQDPADAGSPKETGTPDPLLLCSRPRKRGGGRIGSGATVCRPLFNPRFRGKCCQGKEPASGRARGSEGGRGNRVRPNTRRQNPRL
jgi:hypothetical protein